jgi:hypothetical protein
MILRAQSSRPLPKRTRLVKKLQVKTSPHLMCVPWISFKRRSRTVKRLVTESNEPLIFNSYLIF